MGLLALLLSACASGREVRTPGPYPPDVGPPPEESGPPAVYIIHGDADYLYHDAGGNRLQADEEALRQAREAALGATRGNVFIFHQRTGLMRKLWGSRGGVFEHYRAGRLVERTGYARRGSGFVGEAAVLRRLNEKGVLQGTSAEGPALLAYFGHEIPPGGAGTADEDAESAARGEPREKSEEAQGSAPSALDRDGSLTIPLFARGLRDLATALYAAPGVPDGPSDTNDGVATTRNTGTSGHDTAKPYALVVLSTCYGGTPDMMRALAPLADFAVASPAYLHLSYLETRPLAAARFSATTPKHRRKEAGLLADSVARASFRRLREKTMTEVTVAVYDLNKTVPPAPRGIATAQGALRWRDCAADPAVAPGGESARGVTLHYQPPRFGAGKNTASRSAWQCPL